MIFPDKKRAEEQIQASLREKEVLLREIHHRVKNNLQVIYSLLRLQSKLVTDPKASALFKDSQARVKAMALVHETLWQSKNLSRIDMSEYSRILTRRLFESYGISSDTLGLNLNIAPVSFSMETAVSCGQLINELVSNCLKHAFPNGRTGDVTVELLSNGNDTYLLTVSDNGVGLPPDFEVGKAESLGWQLVPDAGRAAQWYVRVARERGHYRETHLFGNSLQSGGYKCHVPDTDPYRRRLSPSSREIFRIL
mgnify:CR=1 FL=1